MFFTLSFFLLLCIHTLFAGPLNISYNRVLGLFEGIDQTALSRSVSILSLIGCDGTPNCGTTPCPNTRDYWSMPCSAYSHPEAGLWCSYEWPNWCVSVKCTSGAQATCCAACLLNDGTPCSNYPTHLCERPCMDGCIGIYGN
jgi:hypothetical protein